MKITKTKSNAYSFSQLSKGDVFKYKNDIFIKTEPKMTGSRLPCNAVNLDTGFWTYFNEKDNVTYVNAELLISE